MVLMLEEAVCLVSARFSSG